MMRNRRALLTITLAGLSAAAMFSSIPVRAQEYGADFGRFLGVSGDHARYDTDEQFGDRGPFLWEQSLDVSNVVYKSSADAWTVNARAAQLDMGSPGVPIAETQADVPVDLWNIRAGGGYTHDIGDRRRWGASASFGSASDEPFLSWRDDEVNASLHYQMPSGQRNSWIFLLNYSNNRPLLNNIPIPGFAYLIDDPAHHLTAAVGFPFLMARWQPAQDWTLSGQVFGAAAYSFQVERRMARRATVYARLQSTPLQWLRAARSSADDRLIFDSKEALLGLRTPIVRWLALDLSAGRTFDRSFFEALDAENSAGVPKTFLADAWVARAALTWRWGPAPGLPGAAGPGAP